MSSIEVRLTGTGSEPVFWIAVASRKLIQPFHEESLATARFDCKSGKSAAMGPETRGAAGRDEGVPAPL
jgi:hypothetical protein